MKITIKILVIFTFILAMVSGIAFFRNFQTELLMNQKHINSEDLALNGKYRSNGGLFTSWAFDDANYTAWRGYRKEDVSLQIDFGKSVVFDTIILREDGLNVQAFRIQISDDGESWDDIYIQDKIEPYRLCSFDAVSASHVRLVIDESDRLPAIRSFEVYHAGKVVRRDPFRVTAYMSMGHIYEALMDEDLTEKERDRLLHSEYFDTVTDVFFIFDIKWDEYGNIGYGRGKEMFANAMEKFKEMIGERDVNIFVTILNPHDNGKVMKSITDNRDTLLDNMIDFANEYELDGIDLDWEFPFSQDEFDAYNSFLRELKARMIREIKPDAQLSLALATWALRYEQETIDIIDQIQIMGYDILDHDGHHSSFFGSAVQPVQYLLDQGFSKDQLNIGFPFYGTYLEGRMEQYLYKNNEKTPIDEWSNMYDDWEGVGQVYFNSPAMLKDKTAYALYSGVSGVMIFSLYCDIPYSEELSLTRALTEIIHNRLDTE